MKVFLIALSFIIVPQAFSKSCSGYKPLSQPGCSIECKDGNYVQNCSDQKCGPKPLAKVSCKIGDCVNGSWEIECGCGLKPIPTKGCVVTECKDGEWIEDCSKRKCPSLRPLSAPGCKIECKEGAWKQICD
jgi:hypothetical protein